MNVVFVCIFILACVLLIARDPSLLLPALLEGAKNAVALGLTLAAIYTVWLGFLRVAQDAGILRGLSRAMRPLTSRLFRTRDPQVLEHISVNLAANFLGMGAAATGAGICAMRLLGEQKQNYARAMFFVVNCAGLQLLPTTALSVRVQAGSLSPYDIVLPVLAASLSALVIGALLVRIVFAKSGRKG